MFGDSFIIYRKTERSIEEIYVCVDLQNSIQLNELVERFQNTISENHEPLFDSLFQRSKEIKPRDSRVTFVDVPIATNDTVQTIYTKLLHDPHVR